MKVAIWGSCVSRDTVKHDPNIAVKFYVARQSAISNGNDASQLVEPVQFSSLFQQRMNMGDLQGTAMQDLVANSDADLIVRDIVDERLGVYRIADGKYATRTVERIQHGVDGIWQRRYAHIPFGCDEHFALWSTSEAQVLHDFRQAGLLPKLRLIAVPAAMRSNQLGWKQWERWRVAWFMNLKYERYYRFYKKYGIRILSVPFTVTADVHHKWGRGIFHYTPSAYQKMVADLVNSL